MWAPLKKDSHTGDKKFTGMGNLFNCGTMPPSVLKYYQDNAGHLVKRYEQVRPAVIHASWAGLMPAVSSRANQKALDIGAGSGRDAAWLAGLGYRVYAVEPVEAFMQYARQKHSKLDIVWLADRLPELAQVRKLEVRFDVILMQSVVMHLPPEAQRQSVATAVNLLAPGGLLVVSWKVDQRDGCDEDDGRRLVQPVSTTELVQTANLTQVLKKESADKFDRPGIKWITLVIQRES